MIAAGALIAGCRGKPLAAELESRRSLDVVGGAYRPGGEKPTLPTLTVESRLQDFLLFAMLNNPSVEARYYEWAASIENTTTARSLPDPRLTFETDIADAVMTLMPGLMMDFPGPGKLRAAGQAAHAESVAAYFAFKQEVLATAHAVKSAYFRLKFLDRRLAIVGQTRDLLIDFEDLARQQNAAGRVTLQDVLRAQIARERVQNDLENLEDSRSALMAEWKSALGLSPQQSDPPAPLTFDWTEDDPDVALIWSVASSQNPLLLRMRAEVDRAQAMLELAKRAGVPDFSLGIEGDVKASPVMLRPSAAVTLPIWRDKIEAELAGAQARKAAAEARLTAEQIALATDLAAALYAYRESVRNIALASDRLLPRARQSLEAARSGYVTGRASFLDLIDAERSLLDFELMLLEAQTQRELALSTLSLLIAGNSPPGAPLLPVNQSTPSELRRTP